MTDIDKELSDVNDLLNEVSEQIHDLEEKRSRLEDKKKRLIELKQKKAFEKIAGLNWESKGKIFVPAHYSKLVQNPGYDFTDTLDLLRETPPCFSMVP